MIDWSGLIRSDSVRSMGREIELDALPLQVAAAFHDEPGFVFLDSSGGTGSGARCSVLGWAPALTCESKDDRVTIRSAEDSWRVRADPLHALDELLQAARSVDSTGGSSPYSGGAIGYLGYDLFPFVERYESLSAVDDLKLPDSNLGLYDVLLVYDHVTESWSLSGTTLQGDERDLERRLDRRLETVLRAVEREPAISATPSVTAGRDEAASLPYAQSSFERDAYLAAVDRSIEYIRAGDVYQVNLSQRFGAMRGASDFELFRVLRGINPSAYGAYLSYDGHAVISASPELFLRKRGLTVETHPIKGTRPRGSHRERDLANKHELLASEKDRAELSMIVDLMRNDLGRVCEYGSVKVADHRRVEELPTVFHTVSTVRGEVRDDVTTAGLIRAAFPGGSVTGCPKIRAIEIIDELEPTKRNAYTGAIGYLGFDGDLCLNVAIRTMISTGDRVYYQVGGGIVADSDPEAEFDETLDKGAAMQRAIEIARLTNHG